MNRHSGKILLLVTALMLLSTVKTLAQASYANYNWFFGNSVYSMQFNRPNLNVSLDSIYKSPPFGSFGNATATEPETGNLLFYTDGQYVYDASFQLMDGIIAGNPAFLLNADVNKNQNTAIISMPGNNQQYIIFTNTPGGAINYSIVDMSQPGNAVFPQPNLGSVTVFNQSIPASTANASQAMLALAKGDLSGYWLITLDQGSNVYKVLDINGANPAGWTEQTYTLGTVTLNAAHLSFSDQVDKIAVAPASPNTNVQLLDFDRMTGVLSFDTEILNSGFADQATEAVYDVEWSPDGSKLYISRYGGIANTADVLQYDFNLPAGSSLLSILPAPVFGSYGLQRGPDNNIYHLYQEFNGGPLVVGRIRDADSVAAQVQYDPTVFATQNINGYQFPATLPPRQVSLSVDFTYAGTCSNSPTTFYPLISPPADRVYWDFGDGGNSTQLAPIYTYASAGTYNVMLIAELNNQTDTVTKAINITQFDLQLILPSDTVACQCELPKYGPTCTAFSVTAQANNAPAGTTYLWSNGDTGPTLTPDSAGYYYVVATDPTTGCTAYAGVNVQEYGATDQRANVWYFGQNAGIDFNPPATNALSDSQMDAPEGCTAVSDRNGVVLFYTDGDQVFVKDKVTGVHSLLDTGLGGDPGSSQSVIAVPFPNDETQYYIFTTQEAGTGTGNYEFKYSVFDIKLNGGSGGIAQKNITLFTKSTERITANTNWVIIHEYGNNNFRAYPLTPTGIGIPVVTSIGADHSFTAPEFAQGYMKLSGDGTKLAVALAEGPTGPNYLEVFAWDNTTGRLSNYRQIDLTADGANGKVYGVEFAPNGGKLFATVSTGAASQIMEYRSDTISLMRLLTPIMTAAGELGAIQNGPDGQTYVAVNGSGNLGLINVNGDTATASTYTPSGFPLAAGTTSRLGLPNFAQSFGNAQMTPSYFVSSPVCLGQQIVFTATTTSVIDTAYWQIADSLGNVVYTSPNLSDSTVLSQAGDYLVSLLIGNRCGFNTAFSQTITVNAPPPASSLPAGLPLCGSSMPISVYDTPPPNINDFSFSWSTGDTTNTITVSNQGTYDVTVTDRTSGCTTTASVFIGPPFTVDLGPDVTICENDALVLDCQANASNYFWYIDNNPVSPANNQRTFDFGALNMAGGNYTVRVEVEDPADPTCLVVDEAIVTVNPLPVFTAAENTAVTTCGGTDGTMVINLSSTGNFTYTITGPVSVTAQPLTGPNSAFIVSNLSAGVYNITITDNVSACNQQLSNVIITEPAPFTIVNVNSVNDDCLGGNGQISFETDINAGSVNYTIRDQNNPANAPVTGTSAVSGPGNTIVVNNLAAGTYSIEVTDTGGGCTNSFAPVTINPTPVTDLQVAPTLSECGTTLDLSAYVTSTTPSANFEWGLSNSGPFNPIATAYTDLGNQTVYIKAASSTTCDSIRAVDVTLVPTPTVTIDIDTTQICSGQVVLTANADGGYAGAALNYRWSSGQTSPQITVTQTGTYTVTVSNQLNQNCFVSQGEAITIPQPFTVALSSTLACDDGKPFTLSTTVSGQSNNLNLSYSWWLNGLELPDITSQIQSTTAGQFVVIVTDNGPGQCSQSDTLDVVKAPVTPTTLSSSVVFCPDEGDITLDAGPDFVSYAWNTGDNTRTISVNQGGVYVVNATNNFNCVTTDQSEVLEDCIPKVYGPTAFKPGGLNSEFYLFTQYVDTFEIFIYNRWGKLVFYSNDLNFRWDGTFNGEPLPADQYTWRVLYTSSFRDRGTLEKYGGVMLLR